MIIRNSQVLSKNGNEWKMLHFSRIHRTCWGLPGAWPGKEPSGCEDSDFLNDGSLYNPPRSWYHPGLMNKISWFRDILFSKTWYRYHDFVIFYSLNNDNIDNVTYSKVHRYKYRLNVLHNHLLFVSLPKEFLKKGYNMALKIKNREEAIAVLRDMVQRKKEMEKQVQEEFAKVRKEAENS